MPPKMTEPSSASADEITELLKAKKLLKKVWMKAPNAMHEEMF